MTCRSPVGRCLRLLIASLVAGAVLVAFPVVLASSAPHASATDVAGDVLTFGTAANYGSLAGTTLNAPIVGMAATPDAKGYWLVASDGGIFNFGDAGFYSSMGGKPLNAPIVGMAATPDAKGYWLVASDGGIFNFGDAGFYGSAGGQQLAQPAVGIVAAPGGSGYWVPEGQKDSLVGKVVVIDPGHNGANWSDPGYINQLVWNGREEETCDTTGTETASGYTEALFNFNVAEYLASDLEAQGASVILTRDSNDGVGPCVTQRAAIGNDAHADVALAIHADGGPPEGRGFAVLEPVADGINNAVIGASQTFGTDLRNSFLAGTGEPVSTYDGVDGIEPRDDLGGLNLTTVPKVFIECANMANPADAALTMSPAWQQLAARAIDNGITTFLIGS